MHVAGHGAPSPDTTRPDRPTAEQEARRGWMAVLARAGADEIAALLPAGDALPRYSLLRGPEAGLVMVQGRAGGGGGAFNLGEMTVTRCTLRTDDGRVGHAYVAGREPRRAELAALVDAMMQDPARRPALQADVIAALAARQAESREREARRAAATRVNFFTLSSMRG
jgi:alpha-D-ribose 1-methylphosphonate 5-triphosphate synthase subunit PhnG